MNEQNIKLDVIKNRCNTSVKVIRIFQIIGIIGIVCSLFGTIFCFALKDTVNQGVVQSIASGNLNIESFRISTGILNFKIDYEDFFKNGDYATPMAINCLMAVIITSITVYLLSLFRKIFKNLMEEDNPFSDSILSVLKNCFIVIAIILLLFVGIGPGVIGGLLLWCIYSIFEYGRVIQTEVDETL